MKCEKCKGKTYLFAVIKDGIKGITEKVFDCYGCHHRTTVRG